MKDEYFDIFPTMLKEHIDELRSGNLHKGRFIGMYMEKIKELDIESHEETHFKYPQFVSKAGCERNDTWLDFVLEIDDEEFEEFKRGLFE